MGVTSRLAVGVVVVCLFLGGFSTARAAVIPGVSTLQDLIDLGSTGVSFGNLRFFNFTYSAASGGSLPVPPPTASEITVTMADWDVGLKFTSLWYAENGNWMDSLITYEVVADQGWSINGIGLQFNGGAPAPAPNTAALITEVVSAASASPPPPFVDLGDLSVFNNGPVPPANRNSDFILVSPQTHLHMSKDIAVISGENGVAKISGVSNTFTVIPEPSTAGLVLFGAAFAMLRRRR